MSGKTRIEVYRQAIGFDAQTLPDIITLSSLPPIRKNTKAFNTSSRACSLVSFSSRQKSCYVM